VSGNVRFLGRRDPAELPPLYGATDFQLVSLRDLPGLRGTIPSKLQAALSCGSPVLAATGGDCARLVERHDVGLTSPPDDWAALAHAFAEAAMMPDSSRAEMGRRARHSYVTEMSCRAGVDVVEAMLSDAAALRRRP
jgi:glycosyltransferase involved in cell wall biosynthesis